MARRASTSRVMMLAAWTIRTLVGAAALFLGTEEGIRRGIVQINASHRDPPVL